MIKKIIFPMIQIVIVLAVGMLLILISGANPIEAYGILSKAAFGSKNGIAEVMVKAAPLIFAGLGISVAFRTGFFNIGAEGQLYMGALAATAVVLNMGQLPGLLRILLGILAAFIVGGLWAFIPALLKSKLGISETINTIMFNYIATMLVGMSVTGFLQDPADYQPQSAQIDGAAILPVILPGTRLHAGFLMALLAGLAVWFLMIKTTKGYEMRMSGLNRRASFCCGLPVNQSLILSAFISGGLAGLAGMNEVLGVQYRLLEGISGGNGYTALLIALLAKNNPFGVIGISLVLAAVQVGAGTMQRRLGVPSAIVSILIGFVVLMALCRDFFPILQERRQEKLRRG